MTDRETIKLALSEILGQRMDELYVQIIEEEGIKMIRVSFILSVWTDADLRDVMESLSTRRFEMSGGWTAGGLGNGKISVTFLVEEGDPS